MKIARKKLYQRVTSLSAAFMLVLSTATASMPFIFTQNAAAASASDVWITAAMPNPTSGDSEYVTIQNKSSSTIDTDGWVLNDGVNHTVTAIALAAGASATLCPASASDSICTAGFSVSGLGLNDGGDTITLKEDGAIIDQVSYTSSIEGNEVIFSSHVAAPVPTSVVFSGVTLTKDRTTPSGGFGVSPSDILSMSIDNTNASSSSGFYRTEGLQGSLSTSQSISGELYVDPAWDGKPVRAGLWGTTSSSTASGAAWPIIEYTTIGDGDFTGWRVFDTMNGGWTNLTSLMATPGEWYDLRIAYNPTDDTYDYYLNNTLVVSLPAADGSDVYSDFTSVIFNSYNSATGSSADDYTVQWRGFTSGTYTPSCSADDTTFDTFALGSVNGQFGWSSVNSNYDHEIVSNIYGFDSFGCKSLRVSNGYATGAFDQTFSYSTTNEAGEVDSTNDGESGGVRQDHFEAEFDIASTQLAQQSGLSVSVSPDRGDGSRMSYLNFSDGAAGIDVTFYDTPGISNPANWTATSLGSLDRSEAHTVKFIIDLVDGPSNDVVKIYIDGTLVHTGTTWENYYRYDSEASAEQTPRTIDSLIFHTRGTSVPSVAGSGYLFDNVTIATSTNDTTPPTVPSITTPSNEHYFASQPIEAEWAASTDASGIDGYQIAYNYDDEHSFGGSTCPGVNISGASGFIGCRDVIGTSRNHTPGINEQGGVTIWVRALDNAGNYSAWSAPVHYYYDAAAPADPTLVSPFDGAVVNGSSITQSWNSTSSDVDYYVYESYNDATATELRWDDTYSSTSKTATNVSEATYWWRVKAVDYAGNESGWSDLWKITVDNTAPVAEITNPGDGDLITGMMTLRGEVTDANPMNSFFRVTGPNGYEKTSTYTDGRSLHELAWDTTGLDDGVYTVYFATRDQADNKDGSPTSNGDSVDTIQVVVDNTDPAVRINSPSDTGFVNGTINVLGTVIDNYELSHYNLSLYPGLTDLSDGETHSGDRLNGTVGWGTGTVDNSGTDVMVDRELDTTLLVDGEYQLRLAARDAAGNRDTTSIDGDPSSVHVIGITVDNTDPNVVIDSASSTAVSGTTEPNLTVEVFIDGVSAGTTTADGLGEWTLTFSTELSDGDHEITATTADAAGNEGESAVYELTVTSPSTGDGNTDSGTPGGNGGPSIPTTTTNQATTLDTDTNTPVVAFNQATQNPVTDDDAEVLGAQTEGDDEAGTGTDSGDEEVLGTNTSTDEKDGVWTIFGLAWYWWLLILAAISVFAWWLTRRFRTNEA
jgi:hypothetical protein